MTDTDTLNDDVEQLSEQVLGEIDPTDRLTLAIEAQAAGNDEHVERLKETAEWKAYRQPNKEFQDSLWESLLLSVRALHDLDKRVAMFHMARLEGLYQTELANNHDVSEWDHVEKPAPENGFHEGAAEHEAARFLTSYWAWEQFAEDVLAVSLQEFLRIGLPPEAEIESIEAMEGIASGSYFDDILEQAETLEEDVIEEFDEDSLGWASGETVEIDGEELPPEEAAAIYAEEIKSSWFDAAGVGEKPVL